MTTAQLQTIKTDVTVTNAATVYSGSTLLQYWNTTNIAALAEYYNTVATPQLDLWRPDINPNELQKAIVMSAYIALTAVKQNGFMVYLQAANLDATNQNIRDGFQSIFGAGTQSLINLTALAKKPATRLEKLFAVGNVSSVYGVVITESDVYQAMQV